MKTKINKMDIGSIIFLALAFLVFSVAMPIVQETIDTTNDAYGKYIFNLQQSTLQHSRFISTHDIGHYFEILLQENLVVGKQKKAVSKILDRVEFRARDQLAGALLSASIDPTDESDNPASRLVKFRKYSLEDLEREFNKVNSPEPTEIGQKIVRELKHKNRLKSWSYFLGCLFFIVGTILQIISKRNES